MDLVPFKKHSLPPRNSISSPMFRPKRNGLDVSLLASLTPRRESDRAVRH